MFTEAGQVILRVCGRREVRVGFWWGNPRERKTILKWIVKEWYRKAWAGSIWFRIETGEKVL